MKLNADIIYDSLSKQYNAVIGGPVVKEMTLGRPKFYMEDSTAFTAGHLYLATVEHLPHRPSIQRGAVLVCIGENAYLKYYRDRMTVIVIRNKADFFKAYHALQEIFDRYDEWERNLYRNLIDGADFDTFLADSKDIFRNPLFVLDRSFRSIAVTEENPDWLSLKGESLDPVSLNKYMNSFAMMTEKKGAFRISPDGNDTIFVNLFDKEGQYEGCLCVMAKEEPFSAGTEKLAEVLAEMLENAASRNPDMIQDEQSSVKGLMMTLMNELPISQAQRMLLGASNNKVPYLAVCLRFSSQSSQIPSGYICDMFEETFADSYAFPMDNGIAGFIAVQDGRQMEQTENKLEDFVSGLYLQAGISNEFTDLFDIRIHYSQAESALENGDLLNPGKNVCRFSDYALAEMIINSLGGMPAEAYFPAGFKEVLKHDAVSGVSYLETLKVFLEENMSFSSAAKRLYVHRSTLIDRVERIEKELKLDLSDPDQRLLLNMLIKATELEKSLRSQ